MSIALFYPDNQNRATRCQQLIDDFTNFRQTIIEDQRSLEEKDANLKDSVDTLLDTNGWDNFGGVKAEAYQYLDGTQKTAYDDMIRLSRSAKIDSVAVLSPSLLLIALAGKNGMTEQASKLATLGVVQASIRITAAALQLKYDEPESDLGSTLMTELADCTASYVTGIKFTAIGATLTKLMKSLSTLLVVGQVVSIVLTIWAAIEGDMQRQKLQQGIKDLSITRFQVRLILSQMAATVSYNGEIGAYLKVLSRNQTSLEEMIETLQMVDYFDLVSAEGCMQKLHQLDSGRSSWTNEDPDDTYVITNNPSGPLV